MKAKKYLKTAKKAQDFDCEEWAEQQDLKDVFPPRVMLLLWIGIMGMINYNLVERVFGWDLGLLWVSTFVCGVSLLIGFTLGIEQKKYR